MRSTICHCKITTRPQKRSQRSTATANIVKLCLHQNLIACVAYLSDVRFALLWFYLSKGDDWSEYLLGQGRTRWVNIFFQHGMSQILISLILVLQSTTSVCLHFAGFSYFCATTSWIDLIFSSRMVPRASAVRNCTYYKLGFQQFVTLGPFLHRFISSFATGWMPRTQHKVVFYFGKS